MNTIEKAADVLGQAIFRIETNLSTFKSRSSVLPGKDTEAIKAAIAEDIERCKVIKTYLSVLAGSWPPTQLQINRIANTINTETSAESRNAMKTIVCALFPRSATVICEAVHNHPINQRWDEYVAAPPDKKVEFLLPE